MRIFPNNANLIRCTIRVIKKFIRIIGDYYLHSLQQNLQLWRIKRVELGVFQGNLFSFHEIRERAVQGDHPFLQAGFDDQINLVGFLLSD